MVEEKIKVLIVDDSPMVCDVLETDLTERGYLCAPVGNGKDALIKICEDKFHVMLLNLMLGGGLSGLDVLREIGLRECGQDGGTRELTFSEGSADRHVALL